MPVKYECESKNLTVTFARSKILLTEKLTNEALVTPTPGKLPYKNLSARAPHTCNRWKSDRFCKCWTYRCITYSYTCYGKVRTQDKYGKSFHYHALVGECRLVCSGSAMLTERILTRSCSCHFIFNLFIYSFIYLFSKLAICSGYVINNTRGVGFTEPISSVSLFSQCFSIIRTYASYWIPRPYLTGVAAAQQLWWHLSNMNVKGISAK